jgi:aryl-alcohol dehydrogenase-like predicted oxidoreductase
MAPADRSSRRGFLASGLALAKAASASRTSEQSGASPVPAREPAKATGGLRYGVLGNTGLKVTRLGFGCLAVSDSSVIARALDMGINFFDTARSYLGGNSERLLGAALKGLRKDAIIETKSTATTKEAVTRELEASLKELGTDYVDIWLLHSKNHPEDVKEELLEAQRIAKQQGKIRFAGVSTHVESTVAYLQTLGQTDVILTSYNFSMHDLGMEKTIQAARHAGKGIVAMKTMAGGYARVQRWDDGSSRGRESQIVFEDPKLIMSKLKRPGLMPAALRWALRNQDVDTAIVGIVDADQLEENFACMSAPLTEADQKLLSAHLERIRPIYCRMCGACAGQCRKDLPVPDMLRILTYADGYGQFPLARERFQELPERTRQVRCADCAACSVRCPNGVAVAARLERAQEWLA